MPPRKGTQSIRLPRLEDSVDMLRIETDRIGAEHAQLGPVDHVAYGPLGDTEVVTRLYGAENSHAGTVGRTRT